MMARQPNKWFTHAPGRGRDGWASLQRQKPRWLGGASEPNTGTRTDRRNDGANTGDSSSAPRRVRRLILELVQGGSRLNSGVQIRATATRTRPSIWIRRSRFRPAAFTVTRWRSTRPRAGQRHHDEGGAAGSDLQRQRGGAGVKPVRGPIRISARGLDQDMAQRRGGGGHGLGHAVCFIGLQVRRRQEGGGWRCGSATAPQRTQVTVEQWTGEDGC